MKPTLSERMSQRILVLDGAMGTMLQKRNLSEEVFHGADSLFSTHKLKGLYDVLNLTAPLEVEAVHRLYLEAGADVIETNTFNAQRVSLAAYGLEDQTVQINLAAAMLARRVADEYTSRNPQKPRYVVGAVGPTPKICVLEGSVTASTLPQISSLQLQEAYLEQISALIEGGVDALLIETIYHLDNARVAVRAAIQAMEAAGRTIPLMLSFTIPQKISVTDFCTQIMHFVQNLPDVSLLSVGMNCSWGPEKMKPYVAELSHRLPYYIIAYPNAGLPDAHGRYSLSPSEFAEIMQGYADEGMVRIVGGCCGTTEEYIRLLADGIERNQSNNKP